MSSSRRRLETAQKRWQPWRKKVRAGAGPGRRGGLRVIIGRGPTVGRAHSRDDSPRQLLGGVPSRSMAPPPAPSPPSSIPVLVVRVVLVPPRDDGRSHCSEDSQGKPGLLPALLGTRAAGSVPALATTTVVVAFAILGPVALAYSEARHALAARASDEARATGCVYVAYALPAGLNLEYRSVVRPFRIRMPKTGGRRWFLARRRTLYTHVMTVPGGHHTLLSPLATSCGTDSSDRWGRIGSCAVADDLLELEVIDVPGLSQGLRFRFTAAAVTAWRT